MADRQQAHATADTWEGLWSDLAAGALGVHCGKLVPLPGALPPLDPVGVPPLTYSERDSITAAWQSVVEQAGALKRGPSADTERWPAMERVLAWTPPPAGPHAKIGDLLPTSELQAWWASTANLALDLDTAGVPVTAFGVQYDLPTTPPGEVAAPVRTPPNPVVQAVADAGAVAVRNRIVWPTLAVVAVAGLLVYAVSKRRRRRRRR